MRRAGEIQRKRELMAAADAKRLEIRTAQRMQRAAELAAFLKTATAQPPLLWLPARHCEDTLLLLEQRQVDLAAWQARHAPREAHPPPRGRVSRYRACAGARGVWAGQGGEAHVAAGRFLGRVRVGLGRSVPCPAMPPARAQEAELASMEEQRERILAAVRPVAGLAPAAAGAPGGPPAGARARTGVPCGTARHACMQACRSWGPLCYIGC